MANTLRVEINKKKYRIPKLSSLTVGQFITVTENNPNLTTLEYVSLFTKIPVKSILKAAVNNPSLLNYLIDIDYSSVMSNHPIIFTFEEEDYFVKSMEFTKYGQDYTFSKLSAKYAKELSEGDLTTTLQLAMYQLAVLLSNSFDIEKVEKTKKKLEQYEWVKVLPVAFFLLKKNLRKGLTFKDKLMMFIEKFRIRKGKKTLGKVKEI